MTKQDPSEQSELNVSFASLFFVLGTVSLFIGMLYVGQTLLAPVAFAILISFIMYPMCVWIEKRLKSRTWAIIVSFFLVTLVLSSIIFLFSSQLVNIVNNFEDFTLKLNDIQNQIILFINTNIPFVPEMNKDGLLDMGKQWFTSNSGGMLAGTLNVTGVLFTGIMLTFIYTFLMLLYRDGIKNALSHFVPVHKRPEFLLMLRQMRKVGQKYVSGMLIIITILATLNTIGLLILGIEYAVFFAVFAAFLGIIPYIGTTLGGALPAIYALMTTDSLWVPVSVVLVFWFIQLIEGNYLSPRIMGGNLNINALVSLLALILGGLIWGVAGMILFLPFFSIFKVACDHYKELQPIGKLIQGNLYVVEENNLKAKIDKLLHINMKQKK
jgi:predicted PurR-regulated permease PerM